MAQSRRNQIAAPSLPLIESPTTTPLFAKPVETQKPAPDSLSALLADLHLAGVMLSTNAAGTLIARPRANLSNALSVAIASHKAELLVLVAQPMEFSERVLWGLARKAQVGSSEAMTAYLAELKRYEAMHAEVTG